MMSVTRDDLRRMAVRQSLFTPTTLKRALQRMHFVQADPIRAPARAQDLILRHRVNDYCAGDLERDYAKLGVEEDFFVNYGFVTRELQALMHPRSHSGVPAAGCMPWPAARRKRAQMLFPRLLQASIMNIFGKLLAIVMPHRREAPSPSMCPFCGLITPRYKRWCLECGKSLKPA